MLWQPRLPTHTELSTATAVRDGLQPQDEYLPMSWSVWVSNFLTVWQVVPL